MLQLLKVAWRLLAEEHGTSPDFLLFSTLCNRSVYVNKLRAMQQCEHLCTGDRRPNGRSLENAAFCSVLTT